MRHGRDGEMIADHYVRAFAGLHATAGRLRLRGAFGPAALALCLACVASPVLAQSGLRLENPKTLGTLRSGGPLYVTGELQSDRADLVEGRLRFTLHNGIERLSVVETDPIVVVSGNLTRFRQLLPVPEGQLGYGVSEISVEFVTKDAARMLGPILVPRGPAMQDRWQAVVLSVEPTPDAGLGPGERLQDAVLFERAIPDPVYSVRDGEHFNITTSRAVLAATDLPEQSLAYCPFDVVAVPGEALTRLTARQGTAIADWVRAGGAVCLVADRPLERKQVDLLEDLFRDANAGPFVRDDDGVLLEPDGTQQGVFARRAGLGFAVVLFGSPDTFDFKTAAWREAHARLWRLREQYVAMRRDGKPITVELFAPSQNNPTIAPGNTVIQYGNNFTAPGQYGFNPYASHPVAWRFPPSSIGTSIVTRLRPESIRLLPGWIVVAILFGYVAVVGPLDYLVLGRLRLRKWTWLTFPAATLAVTWGVVATANSFMSVNDHVRSVDVVDLDANGEPVRRTRLDLHFRGSTSPVVHEIEQAWFSPLDLAHFTTNDAMPIMRNGRLVQAQHDKSINTAPTGPYTGTIASRYAVPQQIAKWTPQVNRTFEIAPAVTIPDIDWARLEGGNDQNRVVSLPGGRTGTVVRYGIAGHGAQGGNASLLATAETSADPIERWSLVFQRSPLGLGRLDDLPFVDVTAERSGAIAVWTRDPEKGITIYRKPVRRDL